jgi:hypothetical protein
VLLTAAPCKTPNFLCGLAVGVCAVNVEWVNECLASKRLCAVDSCKLPAGTDPQTKQRIRVPKHFSTTPMPVEQRVLGVCRVCVMGYLYMYVCTHTYIHIYTYIYIYMHTYIHT